MIQVRLKNPTLIITPVSQEELNEGFGWGSLYALYKNENGEVEIGIPDMIEYFPEKANMFGFSDATEKAFFYNGGGEYSLNPEKWYILKIPYNTRVNEN